MIRDLRRTGVGVIYISHRLDEMAEIVDRVTVLRDGRMVGTSDLAATTVDAIVAQMVGRALEEKFPPATRVPDGQVLFEAEGLTRKGVFHDIGFSVRRGEILGFAGLIGAGRTEVARAVFGADPLDSGTLSVAANMTLANMDAVSSSLGLIDHGKEAEVARRYVDLLDIRTPGVQQPVRLLSGGNQQKIIIGKWLFRGSRLLFFDEPTRGIDVGARYAIYRIMDELASRGVGVVLISSDLPEIIGMSDRVAVFHAGRIAAILDTRDTDQEEIMQYASGRGAVRQASAPIGVPA